MAQLSKRNIIIAEFCPKCYYPVSASDDDSRLCEACQWWGDKSEALTQPPIPSDLETAFAQLLALYREVCRMEMMAEDLAGGLPQFQDALNKVRSRAAIARTNIMQLFRETRRTMQREPEE